MTSDPYSQAVRARFAAPRHAGLVAGGAVATASGPEVRIELSCDIVDGSVEALRFRAWGCPHVIAAAEVFCENYEGRQLSDLESFDIKAIIETLSVPIEKTGRILVLEDAVRRLAVR